MKKLISIILTTVMLLGLCCSALSEEDAVSEYNKQMAAFSEQMIDAWFDYYDENHDESKSFAIFMHYYLESYLAMKNADIAYSSFHLGMLLGDTSGMDEAAVSMAEYTARAKEVRDTLWNLFISGDMSAMDYVESMRETYNIYVHKDE